MSFDAKTEMFLLLQDGAGYQVVTSTVTVLITRMSWVRAPQWPPKKITGEFTCGFLDQENYN